MKPIIWAFWFNNDKCLTYSGSYTVARCKAISEQISQVGECSCYLEIEKVERKENGKWVEAENEGI